MKVRAIREFNHGGIVKMKVGDADEIRDDIAKKLIRLGLVVENKISHKKIIKKDEPKAENDNA